jgi:hypothetical protein
VEDQPNGKYIIERLIGRGGMGLVVASALAVIDLRDLGPATWVREE